MSLFSYEVDNDGLATYKNSYKSGNLEAVSSENIACDENFVFVPAKDDGILFKFELLSSETSSPADSIKSIRCFGDLVYVINLFSGLMAYSFTEGAITPFLLLYNSTKPTYTVTYDGNGNTGGVVPVDSTTYKEKDLETVTVLENTGSLVKVGYTFAGWNTAANGSGTSYTGGTVFIISSASIILYAQWTLDTVYTITYDGNLNTGGSVPVDSNNYVSGATATVRDNVNDLTRTGRTFVGWNTAAGGGGTNYAPRTTFVISANLLLYAKWTTSTTYSVTYVAYVETGPITGSVPVDKVKYTSGSTVTVMKNVGNLVVSNSSIFIGWSKTPSSSTIYAPGGTFAISSSNITLYSRFITNENWDCWSDETYMYVAAGYQGLYAFDILTGVMVGYVSAGRTNRCTGVWSDGVTVFTADTISGGFSGVRAWSINPLNPPSTFFSVAGSIDIGIGISTNNIRQYGSYFIVCRYNGLYGYSYSAGTFTPLGSIDPGGESLDIFILFPYILVANGADGIRAYTFDGSTFTQVGYIAAGIGGNSYKIYSDGVNAYVANGSTIKVFQLDYIGVNLFVSLVETSAPGSYYSISGSGSFIFGSNITDLLAYSLYPFYPGYLHTLSVDANGLPTLVNAIPSEWNVLYRVFRLGDFLYAINYLQLETYKQGRIYRYSISPEGVLALLDYVETGFTARDMCIDDEDIIYIAFEGAATFT